MSARSWKSKIAHFIRTLILLIAWAEKPLAQNPLDYVVMHYTDGNGLPQNSVRAMAKDSGGFLWLATEAGLVRFDGQSFFTYDNSRLKIAGNRMHYFLPGIDKTGTGKPAFYVFESSPGYLGVYPDSYARIVKKYPLDDVRSALGNSSKTANVSYLVSSPNIFESADMDTLKSPILGILPVDSKSYYVRRNGSIEYHIDGRLQFRTYFPWNRELLILAGKLFAPKEGDLFRIDRAGGKKIRLTGDILNDSSHGKAKPDYFWNNVSGQAFIHLTGNMYEVKQGPGDQLVTALLLSGVDMKKRGVLSVLVDEFGSIFMGCRTEGLYVYRRKRLNVITVPDDSLGSVFYAINRAGNNKLITHQGYLLDLTARKRIGGRADARPVPRWQWHSLALDKDGNLWVAERTSAVDSRLAKYDADGKRLLGHWDVPGAVVSSYCDAFGMTWFLSDLGKLYYVKSADNGLSAPVAFTDVPTGRIDSYYRSGSGQLWIGCPLGLYLLDLRTRKLVAIRPLEGKRVRSIYGEAGKLWIGTYGNGMYLYDSGKVTHFPLDENRYLAYAHCLVPDSSGRFWVPTNKGLFQVSKTDLLNYAAGKVGSVFYHYFDKASGLNTNEFNGGCQPCGVHLPSGNIAFPSLNGIVYFKPAKLAPEYPDKGILIKEIIVDGQIIPSAPRITVRRDFNQVQISVSTPYYGNKQNIHLEYNLSEKPENQSWIPISNGQSIYISGLLAGVHKLGIRKINGFGSANVTYKQIEIVVTPYWHETKWFYALIVLLLGMSIYFFFRVGKEYVRKQSYNENLLKNARLYGNIITSINHDIQTPMHYVIYVLENISTHLETEHPPGAPLSRMGAEALSSLRGINTRANNLLQYLKVNLYQNTPFIAVAPVPLRPLILEIIEMFSGKIARDSIQIVNQVGDELEYELNQQLFSVILHNIVDNAVKVSKNGRITFTIQVGRDSHWLQISDTGSGMPPEIAAWLTDTSETIGRAQKNTLRPDKAEGLGLVLVKDLCSLLRIGLAIEHVKSGGTLLSLRLTPQNSQP
jgi:ligand-binding sensor domain-containing protein/signal transduction histidine kinase